MRGQKASAMEQLHLNVSLGDDTNLILLPGTRKKKNKTVGKGQSERSKPNSNKREEDRKLMRLQEKKKRIALEAESLKILKKHAIHDDAYSLLHSSGTIGQVESQKKRHLRAANFSKAGLKFCDEIKPFGKDDKRAKDGENDCSAKVFSKKICLEKSSMVTGQLEKEDIGVSDDDENVMCRKLDCQESTMFQSTLELENSGPSDEMVEIQESCPLESATQDAEETGVEVDHTATIIQPELPSDKTVSGPIVVHVTRPSSVEEERRGLPIIMMEQEIMEAINGNPTVIICGETGCGKTTQVPQFLYEAGYGFRGRIGITLPRRVAVLATARRVSHELSLSLGSQVGYQVRHEKRIGEDCSIKFMTDGILLRELQSDLLLRQYSIIILDEAHERSLNTDILIGMLSRVVWLRQKVFMENCENGLAPLKLVLMSATLRVEDFTSERRLFHKPPVVLEVPTRQYPVTVHFSKKRNYGDYIKRASKKVMQIHRTLPPGGILVFVTGKAEVEYLCSKLRAESSQGSKANECLTSILEESAEGTEEGLDEFVFSPNEDDDEEDSYSSESDEEVLNLLNKADSLASLKAQFKAISTGSPDDLAEPNHNYREPSQKSRTVYDGLCVLPLYAMLPADEQLRVFGAVPENQRLVVVATNVAETSLTIPGIKYVVDTGREKAKDYNYRNGMAAYEVKWISKASAAQRAGRAGRTGPGHCYRLYSSAIFTNVFPEFHSPEISKVPVAGVVLLMKSMGISKVESFPFPTPPQSAAFTEANHCLKALEAVDVEGHLTRMGREMARYPMSPRHSRMILSFICLARRRRGSSRDINLVLAYTVASAAALSFHSPFIIPSEESDKREKKLGRPRKATSHASDALTASYLLQLYDLEGTKARREEFCRKNSLHFKIMDEMSKLRKQLMDVIFLLGDPDEEFSWGYGDSVDVGSAWCRPPGGYPLIVEEEELISRAILSGWADRVAKRTHARTKSSDKDHRTRAVRYQSCALGETVYLHPSSFISDTPPEYLVYAELLCTKRPYLHCITAVKSEWLADHATALCEFSLPLLEPKPYYDSVKDGVFCWVNSSFGPHHWPLPLHGILAKDEMVRVSTFACALLEGKVLPCLRYFQKYLAASPTVLVRPESLGQSKVFNLLRRMKMGNEMIDSRAMLREGWKKNPKLLRCEIMCWFHEESRHLFDDLWQRMQAEVLLDGEQLFMSKGFKKQKMKKKGSC